METESGGTLTPDIGALYRTLARLMERGWVEEVDTPPQEEEASSPGRPRRWYGLSVMVVETAVTEQFFTSPQDPRTAAFVGGDMVY